MAEDQTYWNCKQETLSAEEYRLVQEKAFLNELNYVWKSSAFYLQKFTETGLELNDIKGLDDLHKLPFTEKTELRDSQINYPPLGSHAIVPLEKVSRIYSTSGTTGRPTYIGLTQQDKILKYGMRVPVEPLDRRVSAKEHCTVNCRPVSDCRFLYGCHRKYRCHMFTHRCWSHG
jgi:phenylacetate-coenzyme A ligase PaaK-like adenylate-forming protein